MLNTDLLSNGLLSLALICLAASLPCEATAEDASSDEGLSHQRHAFRGAEGPGVALLVRSPKTGLGFIRVEWPDGTHSSSAISAIWKLEVGDLDGDGIDELIVGTWSSRGPHAYLTRRTIWGLDAQKNRIAPVWRGSMLPDPFDDFELRRRNGRDILITHPTGPGLLSTHYRWTGFGFAVDARAQRLPVRITFVGDVAIARYEGKERAVVGPTSAALEAVRSADLVVANLETTVADEPDGAGGLRPLLQIQEFDLDLAVEWGIDAVTRANNHAMDAGPEGWEKTSAALQSRGIKDLTNSSILVGHHTIHVVAAALHPGRAPRTNLIPPGAETELVDAISQKSKELDSAEKLIVSLHGGTEGKSRPTPRMQDLTKKLLKHGVDVVVWHGSHVPATVESTDDGIVAWGLGDFALKRNNKGCALHLELAHDGSLTPAGGPGSCQNR